MTEFGIVIEIRLRSLKKASKLIEVTEYVLTPSVMVEGIVTVAALPVCPVTVAVEPEYE